MNATASKQELLVELLQELVVANLGDPVRIRSANGELFGVFFPFDSEASATPPELSDEERAEFQRRLDTIDDTVSPAEMVAMLRKGAGSEATFTRIRYGATGTTFPR